jgi:hypothetical protein
MTWDSNPQHCNVPSKTDSNEEAMFKRDDTVALEMKRLGI